MEQIKRGEGGSCDDFVILEIGVIKVVPKEDPCSGVPSPPPPGNWSEFQEALGDDAS